MPLRTCQAHLLVLAAARRAAVSASLLAVTCTASTAGALDQPTFTRDVAPILFARCASCHRAGEVGGFPLLSYADARPRAAAIARVTRSRAMPPWKPDSIRGAEFVGARRLSDAEIDIIQGWAAGGAVEGGPEELPSAPRFPDGWQFGAPDLVVATPEPIHVPSGGPDLLRNVVIPVPGDGTRWVRGFEFRPDNPRVVHHANIRVDRTGTARALDDADPGPGFDGRLSGGSQFPDGQFLGWTPGQLPPLADRDSAWRLDAGSDLVVQLHLRPTERAEEVRVRIGFFFADRPPVHTPVMVRLGKQDIDIAAGAADHRIEDTYRLPIDARLLAIQPHAHFRAREVTAAATLPDGREQRLIHIADWDFDWQDQYRYAAPLLLPAGTVLRMTIRYDNSAGNPRNPDFPPRRVRWGQDSADEMGDVWFQLSAATPADRQRLIDDCGRKVLHEDAIGYETLLAREPANARLHEAAAALFLALGETGRGVDHLEAALRLDPGSVEAHYNLATTLAWQGRTDEAIDHLRQALAIAPAHVGAQVNMGALLRARGDYAGAREHLARAIELAPDNAAAHANMGGLLMHDGAVTRAVMEYRSALATSPNLLEPLTELAWTFATSPEASVRRSGEAVQLAERARDLTGARDVRVLDALAAAYASEGRYTDAVTVVDDALRLLPVSAPDARDTGRLLRERRSIYRQRKPFRDPARVDR
jgi:tetratricopeptide (TPR) repeat protein